MLRKKTLAAFGLALAVSFSMCPGAMAAECVDGDCTQTPNNDAEANELEFDDYGSPGQSVAPEKAAPAAAAPSGSQMT